MLDGPGKGFLFVPDTEGMPLQEENTVFAVGDDSEGRCPRHRYLAFHQWPWRRGQPLSRRNEALNWLKFQATNITYSPSRIKGCP